MKLRPSKVMALMAPVFVALAMLVPGTAAAAPKPCHQHYTLMWAGNDASFSPFDSNVDGYVCVKADERGPRVELRDNDIR